MRADVVIVGSGPAGVSAAWPLVEAGLSVIILDAAERSPPEPPSADIGALRRRGDGWRHAFGDDVAGLRPSGDQSPKFATRIGQAVLGADSDPPPIRAVDFRAVRSYTAGGLSALWGAFAAAFDDLDLRDFPIHRSDLAASYRSIAARIGVSGGEDQLAAFHGDGLPLQPPSWLSPIARQLLDRYTRAKPRPGFALGTARNAVLTEARDGREACNRSGLCLYGCSRGAIYHSTQDLAALRKMPNFTYMGGNRVTRLLSVGGDEQVVEFAVGEGRATVGARALVLAAGTLNSSALVLGRKAAIGTTLRLLTNPVATLAFLVPSHLGGALPDSGFSLGQLSYRLEIDEAPDYAMGVLYTADTLPLSVLAERMPVSRRAALRLSAVTATALILATLYLPGRFSRNSLSLELGDGQREELHIRGEIPGETRRLLYLGARRLTRALRGLGAFGIPGSITIPLAGTDGHLAGTLPMREDGGDLTCTPECEIRAWRNVFVVDGSCLSALPAKHCTFTIMANADRAGRMLAKRLVGCFPNQAGTAGATAARPS